LKKLLQQWKTDKALMLAYQAGSTAAFEVLYQRHKDKLFGFLYRSCQDASLVEDIAHEAWLAVIDRAESYNPSAQFNTWLYRIANNRLIDHWRKQRVREDYQQANKVEQLQADQSEMSLLEVQALAQQAMEHLNALPLSQKQAFLLRELGFSLAEIADIQEVEPEAVKSRLRYASKKLRQLLSQNQGQQQGQELNQESGAHQTGGKHEAQ